MIAKVVLMGMFGTVVVVAVIFQITFHAEMHADDFFIFLKLFLTSVYQNDPKHIKDNNPKHI